MPCVTPLKPAERATSRPRPSRAKTRPEPGAQTPAAAASPRSGKRTLTCDEATLVRLKELGEAQCPPAEAAAALEVSPKDLARFLAKEKDARFAFERARAESLEALRRAQLKLAATNATMAIFLGRAYLGQAEQREADDGGVANEISDAARRLRDKLAALAAATPAAGDP